SPFFSNFFFFSSRRRHTIFSRDWSSDVCSSDLDPGSAVASYSGASSPLLKKPKSPPLMAEPGSSEYFLAILAKSVSPSRICCFRSEERRVGKEGRWSLTSYQ